MSFVRGQKKEDVERRDTVKRSKAVVYSVLSIEIYLHAIQYSGFRVVLDGFKILIGSSVLIHHLVHPHGRAPATF